MVLGVIMKYMILIEIWLLQSNSCPDYVKFLFSMSITLWIVSELYNEMESGYEKNSRNNESRIIK